MTLPQPMPFFSAAANFAAGTNTPREFLERCVSHVEEFEPAVGAFVCHDIAAARAAADRSAARWRDGRWSVMLARGKQFFYSIKKEGTPASFRLLQRLIDYGIATGYLRGRTVQRTSG